MAHIELISSACGHYKTWAYKGERWLVVVSDGEASQTFTYAVQDEATARLMCDRAQDEHLRNNAVFIVNFCVPAAPIARVLRRRAYGSNGRVGRAKTMASMRREQRAMAAAEGVNPDDRAAFRAWSAVDLLDMGSDHMWVRLQHLLKAPETTAGGAA